MEILLPPFLLGSSKYTATPLRSPPLEVIFPNTPNSSRLIFRKSITELILKSFHTEKRLPYWMCKISSTTNRHPSNFAVLSMPSGFLFNGVVVSTGLPNKSTIHFWVSSSFEWLVAPLGGG